MQKFFFHSIWFHDVNHKESIPQKKSSQVLVDSSFLDHCKKFVAAQKPRTLTLCDMHYQDDAQKKLWVRLTKSIQNDHHCRLMNWILSSKIPVLSLAGSEFHEIVNDDFIKELAQNTPNPSLRVHYVAFPYEDVGALKFFRKHPIFQLKNTVPHPISASDNRKDDFGRTQSLSKCVLWPSTSGCGLDHGGDNCELELTFSWLRPFRLPPLDSCFHD